MCGPKHIGKLYHIQQMQEDKYKFKLLYDL